MLFRSVDGDSVAVVSAAGGFYFSTPKGDVSIGTQAGDWVVYGDGGAVGALAKSKKIDEKTTLTPGAYFSAGGTKDINFGGPQTKKIKIGVNADLTAGDLANGISISSEKIEIKNTAASSISVSVDKVEIINAKGIYLN